MTTRARRQEHGETLLELLITVTILGLAVASIAGAVLAAVGGSTMHRQQAQAQALLHSWAERVAAVSDASYVACAVAGSIPAPPSDAVPAGFTASVTRVQYWDAASSSFGPSCGTDSGVQQVRLTVTAPQRLLPAFSEYVDVVVRRPCATAGSC